MQETKVETKERGKKRENLFFRAFLFLENKVRIKKLGREEQRY